MAYLMTHFWPGGTDEQYRTMIATVHPPDGCRPASCTMRPARRTADT